MAKRSLIVTTVSLAFVGNVLGCTAMRTNVTAETSGARGMKLLHDPALRTGRLPNGMRYYVRANHVPSGRAYLWLAVNAGSVVEDEDQRGYAHFLEHMAFNGTKHFPHHELIAFVESSGMEFGADLNAWTTFDETVYALTVPTDVPAYLNRALTVLKDWASGGITLDSAAVAAERGVVLAEWRSRALRDSVTTRLRAHIRDVFYGGTRYRKRFAIGTAASIKAASVDGLRRFYRDWYRPGLMAVVAVGDFDAAAMERRIRRRFGAIPARDDPRPRPVPELPVSAEPVVDILRDKVSPRVQVLWPTRERPQQAAAAVRHNLITDLLFRYMQLKLLQIANQDSRPFISADLGRRRLARPLEMITVRIFTWPDSLEAGLAAVLTELERIARYGVPSAWLAHQKALVLLRLEEEANAAVRPSAAYGREYLAHYLRNDGPLLSEAQRLRLAREILPEITPEMLAEAARFWRDRDGLKVIVRIPRFALGFRPPSEPSVLALLDSIRMAPLEPSASVPGRGFADNPLITQPPIPGRIVAEVNHPAAGVVEWTLSNGARVLVKPTRNKPDEVLIRAWSPGGFSRLPDSLFFTTGRMVAYVMEAAAGFGEWKRQAFPELEAVAGIRFLDVNIGYAEETIELAGSPKDLEMLFKMLHLQFTAPKLDSAAMAAWANVAKYARRPFTIHDALSQIFARGNPKLAPVQTQLAELAHVKYMRAVHRDRFGNAGDFTFLVVGAATPGELRSLVERYIASLPATEVRETPKDPKVRPFVGRVRRRRDVAEVARAHLLLAFDGLFPTNPELYFRERQRLSALTLVLQRRLRRRLREDLAGTYHVAVSSRTYQLYNEHFRVLIQFESSPERIRELAEAMWAVMDSVRARGATMADLETVRGIQQRRREIALQSNRYWLAQLELYARLGLPLGRVDAALPIESFSPDAFKQAAEAYLPMNAYIQIIDVPRANVGATADSDRREAFSPVDAGPTLRRVSGVSIPPKEPAVATNKS